MALPPCSAQLRIDRQLLHVTIQTVTGELLLRARLPLWPMHPRAVLELLESIARYSGRPIDAVLSAAAQSATSFDQALWADDIVWGPSPTVRVVFAGPASRQLRLSADRRSR